MKKFISSILLIIFLGIIILSTGWNNVKKVHSDTAQHVSVQHLKDNLDYIDPRIGNIAYLLTPTKPTMNLPNQLIRVYPIRKDYTDDQITSFPLTIISYGVGQVFAVKPWTNNINAQAWLERLNYNRDVEIIHPWYYSTYLIDNDVKVEFTPGKKTGFYKFTFPNKATKQLLFNVYDRRTGSWSYTGNSEITGMEMFNYDLQAYMYGKFNSPSVTTIFNGDQPQIANDLSGIALKTSVLFPTKNTNVIEFKYAISYISQAQAKINFNKEIASTDFNTMVQEGKNTWLSTMNQIKTEGGTEAQKRVFYTALYRSNECMVDINEGNIYYSAYNKKINNDIRPFYIDDCAWGNYTALHPLRTILNPALEEDMLQSYVRMYQQSNSMPTFPVIYGDLRGMTGFHSSIIFLDAYRKGLRNFDLAKAYEGLRKNALTATTLPWRKGAFTTLDEFYQKNGYMPALKKDETETVQQVDPAEKRQAVSVTLANSYDDWAMGQLASELNKKDDYDFFIHRSNNYKNLWNNEQKFFMPKDANGNWININPKLDGGQGGRDYYTENNGWTYIWNVQEDIPALVDLIGGKKAMEERLDALFHENSGIHEYAYFNKFPDATGLVGQFAMGNEPSFHIPFLYNYADAAWKTQSRIRSLLDTWFNDTVMGLPGDDDGGAMSAFVVFSYMGFYPVTPGLPVYTIGSPVFSKITIALPGNKQFTLIADNCSSVNKYIQSATLNGKVLNIPWFTHKQLIAGGTLKLQMGANPNKNWGKGGMEGLKQIIENK